jgi:hypothetical protein
MGRNGYGWLSIGSSGGLLWTRWWTFVFHKETGYFLISWVKISFSNNILQHGVSKWSSTMQRVTHRRSKLMAGGLVMWVHLFWSQG